MQTKSTIICTICVLLLAKIRANPLPNCYASNVQLNSNQMVTVNSRDYPRGFSVPSGCQFTIVAPIYHNIEFTCFYYMGIRPSYDCDPSDSFWYQSNGTPNLDGARQYCGANQMLQDRTPYNSLTMGYTSTYSSGFYTCNFTAKPSRCDCGQRTTTKIVGGEIAGPNAYPYMAVLLDAGTSSSVRGGATIISTTAAITACHVFMRNGKFVEPKDVLISVGRSDLSKDVKSDTPYSATYEIGEIIRHPEYNLDKSLNDIAVIKTRFYILFNRGVGVACLPPYNEPKNAHDGERITAMGFGTTDYGGAYSKQLKSAGIYVLPNAECEDTFDDLTDDDMCTTTYQQDRNDTCQGDSGGPIILSTFRDFLVGIVKDGIYCGGAYPGKCQRVSPFREWVRYVAGDINFFCLYS